MKKFFYYFRIGVAVMIIIIAILITIGYICSNISQQIVKTEIYENKTETLEVEYERNGKSCRTTIVNKNGAIFGFGVDFVNENTAVFDARYALPSSSQYITLVFHDGYIEYSETRDSWGDEVLKKTFYLKQVED